jgi:hypothetical protein
MNCRKGAGICAEQLKLVSCFLGLALGAASALGQPAGALDHSFNPGAGATGGSLVNINHVTTATNGQILAVGVFDQFAGVPAPGLVLLNHDGSVDTDFRPTNRIVGAVGAFQADGKVLAGGILSYGRFPSNRDGLVRFDSNGMVDTNFVATTRPDDVVLSFASRPDGKILVIGSFSVFDDIPRPRIAQIDANGLLDPAFAPGKGVQIWTTNWTSGGTTFRVLNGGVHCVALQSDGSAIVGGEFIAYADIPRLSIARVGLLGELDASYDPAPAL